MDQTNQPNSLHLGWLEVCLNVKDIQASAEFYKKLDFIEVGGNIAEGWLILEHSGHRVSLYQGHIDRNLLNFRGGDVFAIAAALKEKGLSLKSDATVEKDGSSGAEIEDPDGNIIYFNTHPTEIERS